MRFLTLIPAIALSYALLRGWPDTLAPWIRAALAVAALAIPLALRPKNKKTEKTTLFASLRKPSPLDYLTALTAIVLLEFTFITILTYGPNLATDLTEKLHDQLHIAKFGKPKPKTDPTNTAATPKKLRQGNTGNWLWNSSYQRTLPKRANHKPTNRPEVFLTTETETQAQRLNQDRIYIRAFTLNTYNGQTWSMLNPTSEILSPASNSLIPINQNPLLKTLPTYRHTIYHSHHKNGQNVLLALQNPRLIQLPFLTKLNQGTYLLPPKNPQNDGYQYQLTSQPLILEQILKIDPNPQPGIQLQDLPARYYQTIPDQLLRAQLTALLDPIQKLPTTAQQLTAIRDLLRTRCTYSLTVKNPNNLDPIDNFLFGEKTGYCEHFATTAAILARELGIPSRIAFGWTGGKYYQGLSQFVFLASDAHAWTEIYLQGYGWVTLDTTAPDQTATTQANTNETPPELEPEPENPDLAFDQQTNKHAHWINAALLLTAGLTTLAIIIILKSKTTPNKTRSNTNHKPHPEPHYLTAFQKACAARGLAQPPGRTLAQHLKILTLKNQPPPFATALLTYHYQTTYAQTPPNKTTEKTLKKAIKNWPKQQPPPQGAAVSEPLNH